MGHPIEIAKEENNGKKKTAPGWRGLGILRFCVFGILGFWDFCVCGVES
jgi:hypothetical protein